MQTADTRARHLQAWETQPTFHCRSDRPVILA
jgi:hypothetical protein